MGDVLQFDRAKGVKRNIGSVADMIAHRLRDADATRRTRSLKPGRHIHDVTVDVSAIWNHIADVDTDAEADRPIGGLITIVGGHLLLHLDGTLHRPINAIEHDEQGVTARIDDPTAMLGDSWVDQSAAESLEPLKCSDVIQPNQAAVTNHVGMEDGNQLPPAWCPSDQV